MSEQKTLTVSQAYDGAFMAEVELRDWEAADGMLAAAAHLHHTRSAWLPVH